MRAFLLFIGNFIILVIVPLISSYLADRKNPFWKKYDLFGNFFIGIMLGVIYIIPRALFLFACFLLRTQFKREFGFTETASGFMLVSLDAFIWYAIGKSRKFFNTPLLWKIIWVHLIEIFFLFFVHFIIAAVSENTYLTIELPSGLELEL